jgi:hypothetical protein
VSPITEIAEKYAGHPTRLWLSMLRATAQHNRINNGGWLLEHGIEFMRSPTPKSLSRKLRRERQCYRNSFLLAAWGKGRYVYCEGMATNIIPTEHAWVYDRKTCRMIDPTWDEKGICYIGVPIKTDYVRQCLERSGRYGALWNWWEKCPIISGEHDESMWRERL